MVDSRLGVQLAGRWDDATLERVIAGLLIAIAMLLAIEAVAGDTLLGSFVAREALVVMSAFLWGWRSESSAACWTSPEVCS